MAVDKIQTNLRVTPSNIHAGPTIKSGTADAIMRFSSTMGKTAQAYKQYNKTRQAMNFQADVLQGTLGGRKGDDDSYYQALEVGNRVQTENQEFMAEVQADPKYAEMTPAEFKVVYQDAFNSQWSSYAEGASPEEMHILSKSALATQRGAVVWQAKAHADFKHKKNITEVGIQLETILENTADSLDDPTAMVKAALSNAPSLSTSERQSLVVMNAVQSAERGDPRMLKIATDMGLHKDPNFSKALHKASDRYEAFKAGKYKEAEEAARIDLMTMVDEGVYDPTIGNLAREKFPTISMIQTVRQSNRLYRQSLGNEAAKVLEQKGVQAFLNGETSFATHPDAAKIRDIAYEQVTEAGIKAGATEQQIHDEHTRLTIQHGNPTSEYVNSIRTGLNALTLSDGSVAPELALAFDTAMKLHNSAMAPALKGWLGNAETQETFRMLRNQVINGRQSLTQAVLSRQRSLDNPLKFTEESRADVTKMVYDRLDQMDADGRAFWQFAGETPNSGVVAQVISSLVEDKIKIAHVSDYNQAFDAVMADAPGQITTFAGTRLFKTKQQVREMIGLPNNMDITSDQAIEQYMSNPLISNTLHEMTGMVIPEGQTVVPALPTDVLGTRLTPPVSDWKYNINEKDRSFEPYLVGDDGSIHSIGFAIPMADIGNEILMRQEIKDAEDRYSEEATRKDLVNTHFNKAIDVIAKDPKGLAEYGLTPDALSKESVFEALTNKAAYDILTKRFPYGGRFSTGGVTKEQQSMVIRSFAEQEPASVGEDFLPWLDRRDAALKQPALATIPALKAIHKMKGIKPWLTSDSPQ